jgi:sugar transferase (PEP-CTERM/EpsH1 system associated)
MSGNDPRPLIAHVVYCFDVGGVENGIVNLVDRMPHHQWRHAIVALHSVAPAFANRVQRKDVQYVELGKPPGHLVWQYPSVTRVFSRLRPAIVHTRNLAALEAAVPAWLARVPVRIHGEHGWDVNDLASGSAKNRWIRRIYRPFISGYVALSRHLESYLTEEVGVRADAVQRICNGVDAARFRPAVNGRDPIVGSPFNDPGFFVAGTVGRLAAVKDQVNLARAFVHLREVDPAAARSMRLVVVGDGSKRDEIQAILHRGGAAEHAWFAGARGDVPDLMRGFDLFVLPSLAEGISNTILEAMATGLPVVATRVGGNADLIDDGASGTLVPPADPLALAQAMLAKFHAREAARRMGRVAREMAEKKFSLDRMVGDYCDLYQRELTRAGRNRHAGARVETLS